MALHAGGDLVALDDISRLRGSREMRPLVQEPMKATSIFVPLIGAPAGELHVVERFLDGWRARRRCRGLGGVGMFSVMANALVRARCPR